MKTEWLKRGVLIVPVALLAATTDVTAQPTFEACYTEKTGVIYLIDPGGTKPGDLPTACTKPSKHIQVGWTDANGALHSSLSGLGGDDHPQYVPVDGSRAMTGNLGIGTTSAPTSPLTIEPVPEFEILFAKGTGHNAEIVARSQMKIGTQTANPVSLITAGSDRLWVAGNGNVGIGTFAPSEKLSVDGVIETTGGVKFSDGTVQTTAAGPGGVADHGALNGLGDDDHPHYATDADVLGETQARVAAILALQVQIDDEVFDRTTADALLQSGIDSEIAARQAADAAEATARVTADQVLQDQIDDLLAQIAALDTRVTALEGALSAAQQHR